MTQDTNMWEDLQLMEQKTKKDKAIQEQYNLLFDCYAAKYINYNLERADKLKAEYIAKYRHWNNYY